MAKPRIFISSTYFDLKAIRAELNRFILDQGFEPVEHEQGQIPYGSKERLEEYCYQEVGFCDILVAIVGGRFGSASAESEHYSISQMELKTAHKMGIQIYIFVERDVLAEYRTYSENRSNTTIKYASVDDGRIFQFLDDLHQLPRNNPIKGFETGGDIIANLQEQWAGLFQRLLQQETQGKQIQLLQELREAVYEVRGVVRELIHKEHSKDPHPVRQVYPVELALRSALKLSYDPPVRTLHELQKFLEDHGFISAVPVADADYFYFWRGDRQNLFVRKSLVKGDGSFAPMDPAVWTEWYFQCLDANQHAPRPESEFIAVKEAEKAEAEKALRSR